MLAWSCCYPRYVGLPIVSHHDPGQGCADTGSALIVEGACKSFACSNVFHTMSENCPISVLILFSQMPSAMLHSRLLLSMLSCFWWPTYWTQLQLSAVRDIASCSELKHRAIVLLTSRLQGHVVVLRAELCQKHGPVWGARGRSVSCDHGPQNHQEGGEPAQAGTDLLVVSITPFMQRDLQGAMPH